MIASAENRYIKLIRSLVRRKNRLAEGAFLVEGKRLTAEAVAHTGVVRAVIVREDVDPRWVDKLGLDPMLVHWAERDVFDGSSDVAHAQGVAAICNLPTMELDPHTFGGETGFVLLLDRLRDPGNMGTALRSAAAAGIRTVLITEGTVDPYSPKCVRAGMGAHFRLTIGSLSPGISENVVESERDVVLGDAQAQVTIFEFLWKPGQVIVISGETEMLTAVVRSMVTHRVAIPMAGDVESLNAGVAASILMYEARRQAPGMSEIV